MTRLCSTGFALAASGCLASLARAEAPAAVPVVASGQLTSLILSTLVVVALIIGVAWLLKRVAPQRYARNDTLRVVAGAAVGQRERVVVVELGTTWLVLGVAPGRVNLLHQLPRAEQPAPAAGALEKAHPLVFAHWLTKFTKNINENK